MASSDDFKEQLKAGKIADALALVLSQAVKLEITTWVASSSEANIEASSSKVQLSQPGDRLRTNINLLEGKIENEIGSQFISGGPYRELRQFHQEQVADSHKIIQNNLNSLQTLFGILVKLQASPLNTPRIESEPPNDISFTLPPDAQHNEWYLEPPKSTIEKSVSQSSLEPPKSTVEESVAVPPKIDDSLLYAAVGGFALIPHPESESSALTATITAEEDWQDMLVDKSSSAPSGTTTAHEDQQDLVLPSPEVTAPSQSSLNLGADEDWGEWVMEELSPEAPATTLEASNLGTDEDWGELDVYEPPSAVSSQPFLALEPDENWREWGEESSPEVPATSLEASHLGTDEEWREFDVYELSPEVPAASLEASHLGTDVELKTFLAEPVAKEFSWDQGIEEHWEEFEVEERELHPATSDAIFTGLTPVPTDAELEELDALTDLLSIESELNQNSNYDPLAEELEEGSFAQPSLLHEGIDTPIVFDDSLADLFGESNPELETLDETSPHFSPARADMTTGTQTPNPELYSIEDALFASPFDELPNQPEGERSPFEDTYPSFDDSDLLAALDEDHLDQDLFSTDDSNVLFTPPPSPPSNQSSNQHNQKQGG